MSVNRYSTPVELDTELARLYGEEARLMRELELTRRAQGRIADIFTDRGGWTRAFLVDNAGGHVHSSQACSTCFPTTQFGWLTSLSGSTEDEIITAAGELACSVCYPNAPVEVTSKPGTIRRTDQAARDERAAAKAARDAAKAAKAITAPDGTPLKDNHGWTLETETSARIALVDSIVTLENSAALYNDEYVAELKDWIARGLEALAAKNGQSVDAYRIALEPRVVAKRKAVEREDRKMRKERPELFT